jgi:proteasome accessory factor B
MDRTERLLDVVALLLDAASPLSLSEIRDAFPGDYSGSQETAERKFERDKAELLELGIPITWTLATDDSPEGYVIDKGAYYLPEVGLSPAELAVLYAAGSAALASGAFPGRQDLAHALRKIAFFSDGSPPAPKVRLDLSGLADSKDLPLRLEQLWGAINARKAVELEYFSPRSAQLTRRKVDPWGLALRRGLWTLVGYCHLRQGVRVFHVHRVRALTVNAARPRSHDFEVPADFHLDAWVAAWPWQHRFHEPIDVELELRDDLAPLAASLFALAAPPPLREGVAAVTIRATDLDGLLTYVLSLGGEARVTAPPAALERFQQLAQRIADAHQQVATP